MEECIAIVYYHSFPSAVMLILILCKDYGYCEYHLNPFQPDQTVISSEVGLSAHYTRQIRYKFRISMMMYPPYPSKVVKRDGRRREGE